MVESQQISTFHLLTRANIPSIGCFLTILQFFDHKQGIKQLLSQLSKTYGKEFYLKHVKNSTSFLKTNFINRNHPQLIVIDPSTQSSFFLKNMQQFVPRHNQNKIFLRMLNITQVHFLHLGTFAERLNHLKQVQAIEEGIEGIKVQSFGVRISIQKLHLSEDIKLENANPVQMENLKIFMSSVSVIQHLKVTCSNMRAIFTFLTLNDMSYLLEKITKLTLLINPKSDVANDKLFVQFIPPKLQTLNLVYEKSFSKAELQMHENMANVLAESQTISSLSISGLGFFDQNIEKYWEAAFLQNKSMRNLKIKNFPNIYSFGEKFFMALKRRESKLSSFKIDNCTMYDSHLYYFTAFVRRHQHFQKFELKDNCFDQLKKGQGPAQAQPANFQVVEEILGKNIDHLIFAITDVHMYQNHHGENILKNVLTKFKGQKLTLRNCQFYSSYIDNIFQQCPDLKFLEFEKVTFGKSHQKEQLFKSLCKLVNLKYVIIKECNITDSDMYLLYGISSSVTHLRLDGIDFTKPKYTCQLLQKIGKQLEVLQINNCSTNQDQHVQIIKSLDGQNLIKLELTSNISVKGKVEQQIDIHQNIDLCQKIKTFKQLRSLSLSFEVINKVCLDSLAEVLVEISPKIKKLRVISNGLLNDILRYSSMTAISSDDYHKLIQKDPEEIKSNYQNFIQALGSCTQLVELNLPQLMLDKPFFEGYYNIIENPGNQNNLTVVRSIGRNMPEKMIGFMFQI